MAEIIDNKFELNSNFLFSFSYNIEGLRILLSSISKNQHLFSERLNEIENKMNKQYQNINTINDVLKKLNVPKEELDSLNKISEERDNNNKITEPIIIESLSSIIKKQEKLENKNYNLMNNGEEKIYNNNDNNNKNNIYNNNDLNSNNSNKDNNNRDNDNKIAENLKSPISPVKYNIVSKDTRALKLMKKENEEKFTNVENEIKNLKIFFPHLENENNNFYDYIEKYDISIKDIMEKIEKLNNRTEVFDSEFEKVKVKVNDFNIYDLFKDTNSSGDIDAAKILVKSLEQKVFSKIGLIDERIKNIQITEQSNMRLLTDVKNKQNSNERNINLLREKIHETNKDMDTNNKENKEELKRISEKFTVDLDEKIGKIEKNFEEKIEELKENLGKIKGDLGEKIEEIKGEIEKKNEELSNINKEDMLPSEEFHSFKDQILKKFFGLEKRLNNLSDSFRPEVFKAQIEEIKESVANRKPTEDDFFSMNEKINIMQNSMDRYKESLEMFVKDLQKQKDQTTSLYKKYELLFIDGLRRQQKSAEDEAAAVTKSALNAKLENCVQKDKFREFVNEQTRFAESLRREFSSYKNLYEEVFNELKKSASAQELRNLEEYLRDMINEIKEKMLKMFARKVEVNKNFKAIDVKINYIAEMYMRKDERRENWLLSKKPLGGYLCASCEGYIGELTDNRNDNIPWNQFPGTVDYDQQIQQQLNINNENINNRIGNGFSRILNLLDIEREKKNNKNNNNNNNNNNNQDNIMNRNISGENINRNNENIEGSGKNILTYNPNFIGSKARQNKINQTVQNLKINTDSNFFNLNNDSQLNFESRRSHSKVQDNKRVKIKRALINSSSVNHISSKDGINEENKEVQSDMNNIYPLPIVNKNTETDIFDYRKYKDNNEISPKIMKITRKKNNNNINSNNFNNIDSNNTNTKNINNNMNIKTN